MYKLLALCSLCLFFSTLSHAQVSTEGKAFWVSFMEVANNGTPSYQLFITSKNSTTGTVSVPLAAGSLQNFSVAANSTTVVTIPNTYSQVTGSETIQNKGIYVTSLANISVYAVMKNNFRTEASVVLPVASFGGNTEYIVNTYQATNNNGAASRSEFVVVGMKDDTDIIITPSVVTRGNKPAGVPFTVQLDSGQVYQVQSKLGTEGFPSDLSGTSVKAANGCKPFSLFSGATAVRVPTGCSAAWQHLYEQNYPLKTWGTSYLITPFATMAMGFVYKIVASEDNTAITVNIAGNAPISLNLNKGGIYEGDIDQTITFSQGICINATKPVCVSQFMKGQGCNGVPPSGTRADPSMLMLNPTNQTIKKVTFNTVSTPGDALDAHFVNIIVKSANTNKIKLQNSLLATSAFTPILACTGYSYAMVDLVPYGIDANVGSSFTLESDSTFIAYAYGYGSASAYAYSAGASFENQKYNFNATNVAVCIGTTTTFTSTGDNTVISYAWDFGDGSPVEIYPTPGTVPHLYAATGTYNVKLTITTNEAAGCNTDYIIKPYTVLPFPAPALGVDRGICPNTSTVLNPAHSTLLVGSPTYQWYKDGVLLTSTATTLSVNQAGTYKVKVTNIGNCFGEDEIAINIHTVGAVDIINLNTNYCIDNPSMTLQGTPAGGTFTVKGAPATAFYPLSTGLGTHRVIYTYTDANTCVNRDTLMVTVNPLPVVAIMGLQAEYCAYNTRIPLVGTPSGGTFSINSQAHPNNNIKLDSLGAGSYSIKYTYSDVNSCVNTATKTVIINPLPVIDFVNLETAYCIDFTPFTLSATPIAGAFTINGVVSTEFNPSLLGVGAHTVIYSFTDAKTCINTKTQTVTVNPLPTPVITLQDAYCKGQGLVNLVGTPTGGVFTINGLVATDFNTVTMALGEYEVIYTYQDANTCLSRDTVTFDIVPSPVVEITGLQFVYCIDATPFNFTATPHPNTPEGIGIFRVDGGAPVTQVIPSVLGAGIHTVEYTYIDNYTNCIVVKTKDFEISGLPAVSLVSIGGLQDTYCLGNPSFSLVGIGNPSGGVFTISGVVRSVFDPVVIGAGTHTVIYNYQDINGCFNTASKDIVIFGGVVPTIPNLKNNYCVQNPVFNLVGEPVGGIFRINGVQSAEASPLFAPSVLGVGEHTIVYKTLTACDSTVRKIQIYDAPGDVVYAALEMCSFSGDTITLDAGLGDTYLWSNFKTTRVIKVIKSGKYTVTVKDTLGCATTSDIMITEKCDPKFFMPNTFTPNGDGLNDAMKIFGQDFYRMELKIFNRWGEQIFITNSRENVWDGKVGGKPAPAGVYICTVRYLERPNDTEKKYTTYINIIR